MCCDEYLEAKIYYGIANRALARESMCLNSYRTLLCPYYACYIKHLAVTLALLFFLRGNTLLEYAESFPSLNQE